MTVEARQAAQPKRTIVCIEETTEITQAAQAVFDPARYEIIRVTSGPNMLEELRRFNPVVVLVEFASGNMDGWEVYQRIKLDPDLKQLRLYVVSPESQALRQLLHL